MKKKPRKLWGTRRNRYVYEGVTVYCKHCDRRVRPRAKYRRPGWTPLLCPVCGSNVGTAYGRLLRLWGNCNIDDVRYIARFVRRGRA
jgi:hypothetical protein